MISVRLRKLIIICLVKEVEKQYPEKLANKDVPDIMLKSLKKPIKDYKKCNKKETLVNKIIHIILMKMTII